VVSVGVVRDGEDIVVLDLDATETQCVDQIVHFAVGLEQKELKVHGFVQSKGLNSKKQPCGLPASIFSGRNLKQILLAKTE
jgi:hypothetical protein